MRSKVDRQPDAAPSDTIEASSLWAHRFLQSCLARRSGTRSQDLCFSDAAIDWLATIKRANADFAAPILWTAFDALNSRARLPQDVSAYLAHIFDSNARSNEQIRDQCLSIGRMLKGAGLNGVLLKGAAWLFDDGPARHDRMMRDIDLLVPAADQQAVVSTLMGFGYYPARTIAAEAGHIHDIPLIRAGEPANVEIHIEPTTRTQFLLAREMLDASLLSHRDCVWPPIGTVLSTMSSMRRSLMATTVVA